MIPLARNFSERTMAIYGMVTQPITPKEIALELGLPNSTVVRYLVRLEEKGFIKKRYRGVYEPAGKEAA